MGVQISFNIRMAELKKKYTVQLVIFSFVKRAILQTKQEKN